MLQRKESAPPLPNQETCSLCPFTWEIRRKTALHLRYPFLGFSRATSILSPHLIPGTWECYSFGRLYAIPLRTSFVGMKLPWHHTRKAAICQPFSGFFPDMAKLLCILRRFFHFLYNILFFSHIDLQSNYAIMSPSQLERVFPKQDAATAGLAGQGHTDSRVECRRPPWAVWQLLLPYWLS